jgi:hypothetical protein
LLQIFPEDEKERKKVLFFHKTKQKRM